MLSAMNAPKPGWVGRNAAITIITGTTETNACAASVIARSKGSMATKPSTVRCTSRPSGVRR